ncbi:tetratricopeptide repeat protein [Thermodesulfobacteriota bacterium]
MAKKQEQNTREIIKEVKEYPLEKQISIANTIIKNVNTKINSSFSEALKAFSFIIGDLGSLEGKHVLLLQPEKYMTYAVFLSLNGAEIVYGLNRFVKSEERLSTYYEKLLDFILKNKSKIIVKKKLSDDEIRSKYNDIVTVDTKTMRSYFNRKKLRFSIGEDTSMMPYEDGLFEMVISDNSIERAYYPFQSLCEIRRVMADDGLLYMNVSPNGLDITTSGELADRLKLPRESFEKNFTYNSENYCNRIQKSDLLYHLNSFNLMVDKVKDSAKLSLNDFDKKEIHKTFILHGEKDISTSSFVVTATKKAKKNENFAREDFKTYAKGLDLYYKGKYNASQARFLSLMKHPLDGAVKMTDEELAKPKKDDRTSLGLFHALYALKNYEEAIRIFKTIKSPTIKHMTRETYCLADSYYNIEKYTTAKRHFETALKSAPKMYLIHNAIGMCDFMKGDNKEALVQIRKSVRLFPYYSEALNNIGVILESINARKAIEHFKMVLTIDPSHCGALFSMGRLLYQEGYYEEANKYLQDYNILDGSNETALNMHFDCLIRLGLRNTAKKKMQEILEKDPTNLNISTMFDEFMSQSAN